MSLYCKNFSFRQKLPDHLLHGLAVIHIEGLRVRAEPYHDYTLRLLPLRAKKSQRVRIRRNSKEVVRHAAHERYHLKSPTRLAFPRRPPVSRQRAAVAKVMAAKTFKGTATMAA